MREYELLFIVKTEIPEEGTQEVIDRYSKVLTDHGAEVTAVDKWGKRRLAYVI
ncbi:MAG: 30S ribosomal protein S6, partial [Peptococcus niger]